MAAHSIWCSAINSHDEYVFEPTVSVLVAYLPAHPVYNPSVCDPGVTPSFVSNQLRASTEAALYEL